MDCLGCKLANKETEVYIIYENEKVTCILDIDPIHEGHTLILPKKHVEDLNGLDQELSLAIMEASIMISKALTNLYNPDGITILQNNGKCNDLNHYHMHVFPRYIEDGFGWTEPERTRIKPLAEVKKTLEPYMNHSGSIIE